MTIKELQLEKTKHLEILDVETGKTLSGSFTFKRLNIGQIGQLGARISRMNGSEVVDDFTHHLNSMIAHCDMSCIKRPDWFKDPAALHNVDIIAAVYKEVLAFEASFRPVVREEASSDGEAGAGQPE